MKLLRAPVSTRELTRPVRSQSRRGLLIAAIVLFLVLAPTMVDTYNTFTNRRFLDLLAYGNPYSLAPGTVATYHGQSWLIDWPYPPITVLLILPAWLVYQATGSEPLYQLAFKLPLFGGVLGSAFFLQRLRDRFGIPASAVGWLLFNPAVLLLAMVSGGFDAVAMGLLITAYYYQVERLRPWQSAGCLGLAMALRFYPAVLLPAVVIWTWQRQGRQCAIRYAAVALAVAGITFLPVLGDPAGFLATISSQRQIGPFSVSLVVAHALVEIRLRLGLSYSPKDAAFFVLIVATLVALAAVYAVAARRRLDLLAASLATLLVFYALYPKMHPLYVLGLYPLSLIGASRLARLVWLPGVVWYLLFNGMLGANGLAYFLAPLTGRWLDSYRLLGLPDANRFTSQEVLISIYTAIALVAAVSLLFREDNRPTRGEVGGFTTPVGDGARCFIAKAARTSGSVRPGR